MPLYNCEKCQYTTSVKCNFEKHLKTKLHEKNVSKMYHLGQKMYQNVPSDVPKCTISCTQMYQNSINEGIKNECENDTKFICEYCQSKYKYAQGLYRHRKYCKETSMQNLVKELEEKDKVIEEKEKELEEMKKQLDNEPTIQKNCHNRNLHSHNNNHSNNTVNNTVNNISGNQMFGYCIRFI